MKNRGAVVLLTMLAALCIFCYGIFLGRNFTGGELVFSRPQPSLPPVSIPTEPMQRIDLNTADASQIQAIPGIGPIIAQRILEYRAENGPFTAVAQLANVEGVGQSILEKAYELAMIGG